jgi:ParB family chromosome partitioning protein
MIRPALGRGLGSLIPQRQSITEQILPEAHQEVFEISVKEIRENPRQPRTYFSPSELEDLINSIQEYGIIQPLIVTRSNGDYELIAGERRLRAARTLGLKTVPAIVRDATEQQKLELALIENIQRQDLNAVEEAIAYKALIEEFNLTQEQVSKRVGKSRSNIANILRLLELPEEILFAIKDGKISKSHARTLLAEPNLDKRLELFKKMLDGSVSVREAEARVGGKNISKRLTSKKDSNILAHEKKLREVLGTKVEITDSSGKGKISISYYSREEFLDLLDRLIG